MKGALSALIIALVLGGLLGSVAAEAHEAAKVARIGIMVLPSLDGPSRLRDAFRQGLRDLGYVEGRNLLFEIRSAEGKDERYPALAKELAALKVDVIVASGGTPSALAAQQATRTIPIVFINVGDPVTSGLVASLARPGGNVTGLSVVARELIRTRLELLTQAVPGVSLVAVLGQPGALEEHTERDRLQRAQVAGRALGVQLQFVEARGSGDLDRAFSEIVRARAGALADLEGSVFFTERRRLADLAVKNRLPAVYAFREAVDVGGLMSFDVGGLMSYGPDMADVFRHAATYVDKILKGAKPSDLPVEQPTKFELVVNLKTASALGLTIPQSVLARADHIVEK